MRAEPAFRKLRQQGGLRQVEHLALRGTSLCMLLMQMRQRRSPQHPNPIHLRTLLSSSFQLRPAPASLMTPSLLTSVQQAKRTHLTLRPLGSLLFHVVFPPLPQPPHARATHKLLSASPIHLAASFSSSSQLRPSSSSSMSSSSLPSSSASSLSTTLPPSLSSSSSLLTSAVNQRAASISMPM